MPVKLRTLMQEIKAAGCSIRVTSKGHYLLIDRSGNPIESFAKMHPGDEVKDVYVRLVRTALAKVDQ